MTSGFFATTYLVIGFIMAGAFYAVYGKEDDDVGMLILIVALWGALFPFWVGYVVVDYLFRKFVVGRLKR